MAIEAILLGAGALAAAGWAAALGATIYAMRSLTDLDSLPVPNRDWPRVSIIRPACNEAEHITGSTQSTLTLAYPDLEVVLVDDRSTDETPALVDELARHEPRVKVLHIDELPAGWLGKLHAMHRGVQLATGDWLVFADADSCFAENTLQRAIGWADDANLDFISVLPGIEPADFGADAAFSAANAFLGLSVKPWRVERDATTAAATGAFMLVRKDAFDRTPGFEWMPLEVGDDFALCLMIKTFGGRAAMSVARKSVRLPWYRSFGEMTRAMQKNFFGILGRFSFTRCVIQVVALCFMAIAPFLPLASGSVQGYAITAVAIICGVVNGALVARWTGRPLGSALLPWVGLLLTSYIVARAAIVGVRTGGIQWRGVHYPTEQLKPAQRLKL